MQLTFTTVAGIGLFYFLFGKRRFDLFSVAFFSACVYFLPGFLGYALYPDLSSPNYYVGVPTNLVDEVYVIMMVVLFSIFFSGLYFDLTFRKKLEQPISIKGSKNAAIVATVLAVVGCSLAFFTIGKTLFFYDKAEVIKLINRWVILWETAASLGAVLAFVQSRRILFCICMFLLLLEVYIGFRSAFAVTSIAIFCIWLNRKGKQRLAIKSWKVLILGLIFALFVFIYKFLLLFIKMGNLQTVTERLQKPEFYFSTIAQSEPFTIQAILNEVVKTNFYVGLEHLKGIIYQFMLFSPELGAEVVSFNNLFQPNLFPGIGWGMANNIWAEMWSSGGWNLLLSFIGIFVTLLFIGSSCLSRPVDPTIKGGIALFLSYWAFYIHRNDILYQLNLEKNVFLVWFACVFISDLWSRIKLTHHF
jgi:hypothetical protein